MTSLDCDTQSHTYDDARNDARRHDIDDLENARIEAENDSNDNQFDPKVYLKDCESMFQNLAEEIKDDRFMSQIHNHRHAIFDLYKHLNNTNNELDDRLLFLKFIDHTIIPLKHSYSTLAYIVHYYFLYYSYSRIIYCSTLTLVHTSGILQAIFYTLTLLLKFIRLPRLEQIVHYYGFLILNGSLFLTFVLANANHLWFLDGISDHSSSNREAITKDGYKTWHAVYTPVIHYIIFQTALSRVSITSFVTSSTRKLQSSDLIHTVLKRVWVPGYFMLHYTVLVLYSVLQHPRLGRPEFGFGEFTRPGLVYSFFLTSIVSFISFVITSFLTYQYDLIIWDCDYGTRDSGLVLMSFDHTLSIGLIY